MRMLNSVRSALLLGLAAAGLVTGASRANAQNLDLDEMAAALALPIVTGGFEGNHLKGSYGDVVIPYQTAVTLATITNGKTTPVRLKLDLISGDPSHHGGDNWQSTSFECDLTGRETTTFVFLPPASMVTDTTWVLDQLDQNGDAEPNGNHLRGSGHSELYVECSDGSDTDGSPRALNTNVQNGILFVGVADPLSGETISEDVIFGDAVIVDFVFGQAYSFEAISFQAGQGQNDGNKVYRFDNQEYAKFPAVVATNFISPVDGDINAELILITLDGATGNVPVPRVRLGGLAYDDDEEYFDFQWEFDCFDIVSLLDIDPNFEFRPGSPLGLGSMSGHLQLVPQPIATANDSHDAEYGDGNNVRRRPVHGWLVQNVIGAENPWAQNGTFRDEFETVAYNNQDGTLNWSADWDETNDDDSATTGKILITGGKLRAMGPTNPDPRIDREFDAAGFDVGTLRFDIFGPASPGGLDAGSDVLSVSLSADGGSTFTEVTRFDVGGINTSVELDISSFLAQNSELQFRVELNTDGTNEYYDIDNVEVEVRRGGRIVNADEPVPGTPEVPVLGSAAAWGRPLNQSTTALAPFLADPSPVLDADPLE
jgi:hypothetical protein